MVGNNNNNNNKNKSRHDDNGRVISFNEDDQGRLHSESSKNSSGESIGPREAALNPKLLAEIGVGRLLVLVVFRALTFFFARALTADPRPGTTPLHSAGGAGDACEDSGGGPKGNDGREGGGAAADLALYYFFVRSIPMLSLFRLVRTSTT